MNANAYDPELFRAVHAGNPGDVAFYVRACEGARSVLELGCGWGRVLAALRAPTRELVGIEAHEGLLGMARAELPDVALVHGDMASFDLGDARFDRILVPHSGLWCLGSEAAVSSCLRSVRTHLEDGGRLLFDAWNADGFHDEAEPDDVAEDDHELVMTVFGDTSFEVYERSRWDKPAQRLDVTYVHVPHDGGPAREETLVHRYFRSGELERMLDAAGLEVVSIAGGFEGEPFTPDAEHLVVTARSTPRRPARGSPAGGARSRGRRGEGGG